MQAPDEGVVGAGVLLSELSITEVDASVMTNANEGPLPGRRAVAPFPDLPPELQIPQWNGDFASGIVDMA